MIGEERGEERGEETDPFIVDVPGEVGSRPGRGQTAVDGGGVPQVVPPPAAGYQRTSRAGSLHHQEVGVLRVCGKDRSGSTHLTPEPPRGLPADREERHRGPGGARQVHGDPGHRVDRLGLRLVQNKTKCKSSVATGELWQVNVTCRTPSHSCTSGRCRVGPGKCSDSAGQPGLPSSDIWPPQHSQSRESSLSPEIMNSDLITDYIIPCNPSLHSFLTNHCQK